MICFWDQDLHTVFFGIHQANNISPSKPPHVVDDVPWFSYMSSLFSYMCPNVPMSDIFPHLPFSTCSHYCFPMVLPCFFLTCSHIFLHVSHMYLWFPHGFPTCSHSKSGFPMVFPWFSASSVHFPRRRRRRRRRRPRAAARPAAPFAHRAAAAAGRPPGGLWPGGKVDLWKIYNMDRTQYYRGGSSHLVSGL